VRLALVCGTAIAFGSVKQIMKNNSRNLAVLGASVFLTLALAIGTVIRKL
jgi:hypothetical protein